MTPVASRFVLASVSVVLGIALITGGVSGQTSQTGQPSTANGEWPHYTADLKGSRYSPLRSDQRLQLQQAGSRLALQDRQLRPVPRVQARRHAAHGQGRALHDRRHAPLGHRARRQDRRADLVAQPARRASAPRSRRGSCRAAACRTGPTARATSASSMSRPATASSRSTRRPAPSSRPSARKGIVDLKVGVVKGSGRRSISRPARSASIRRRSSPSDIAIVGSAMREGRDRRNARQHQGPGARLRRAHRQAALGVRHHPEAGRVRQRTWENESWAINGNVGVWTQITVDEELGLVYLPVETPSSDFYGGHRPGNNLFAESLVCVDLKTGAAQVALPVRAPPDLELRHVVGAAARRRHGRRQAAQGRGGAEQAGLALRLRSRHRRAGLADRGEAGAAVRTCRARRPAPTQPHPPEALPLRAQLCSSCPTI